jgi:hypothetical protein
MSADIIDLRPLLAVREAHAAAYAPQAIDRAANIALDFALENEVSRDDTIAIAGRLARAMMREFRRSFGDSWFAIPGFREAAIRTASDLSRGSL